MRRIALCATAFALMFFTVARTAAHDGPHGGADKATFKVGKNGEVKIREHIKVGDVLVKRGKYQFEHRIAGDRHSVVLTRIDGNGASEAGYEIPMRLVAGRKIAKRSALHAKELADHSLMVTNVEVAGENSDHVPDTRVLALR